MTKHREWPADYWGGPLGQALVWAAIVVLLIVSLGSLLHGSW